MTRRIDDAELAALLREIFGAAYANAREAQMVAQAPRPHWPDFARSSLWSFVMSVYMAGCAVEQGYTWLLAHGLISGDEPRYLSLRAHLSDLVVGAVLPDLAARTEEVLVELRDECSELGFDVTEEKP